mgnify:CR=1 FL=1
MKNNTPTNADRGEGSRGPQKKIPRLIDKYGLEDIGERMADLWTAEVDSERRTLKELRDMFNQEILRSAVESQGVNPVGGEIEFGYKALISDNATYSQREDFIDRMEDKGVDIESIQEDFIKSSATIHNYLKDVHNAQYKTEDQTSQEKAKQQVKRLQTRAETVSEGWLNTLVENDQLPDQGYNVSVEFWVDEEETGRRITLQNLIDEIE